MLNLNAIFGFRKRHVEGNTSDNGLPCFIFREPPPLDRSPETNNLFLCHAFEEILIPVSV